MKFSEIFYLLSIILLGLLIFSFSAQTGEISGGLSEKVTDVAVEVINIGKERINPSHSSTEYQTIHTLVRKMAHFSIYAALGFFVCGFLASTSLSSRPRAVVFLSLAFCFLYACTDELHQGAVAGRGPAFTDVLIDSAGALIGIAFQFAVLAIIKAITQKRSEP